MRRYTVILALSLCACGGRVDHHTVPAAPPVMGSKTAGVQYNPVAGASAYTLYCDRSVLVTKTAPVISSFLSPVAMFASVPFPAGDDTWYCGMTARSSDTDESNISGRVLGVRKSGTEFYKSE